MKVKLEVITLSSGKAYFLRLPIEVINELGWRENDVVDLDIPTVGSDLVINKA